MEAVEAVEAVQTGQEKVQAASEVNWTVTRSFLTWKLSQQASASDPPNHMVIQMVMGAMGVTRLNGMLTSAYHACAYGTYTELMENAPEAYIAKIVQRLSARFPDVMEMVGKWQAAIASGTTQDASVHVCLLNSPCVAGTLLIRFIFRPSVGWRRRRQWTGHPREQWR